MEYLEEARKKHRKKKKKKSAKARRPRYGVYGFWPIFYSHTGTPKSGSSTGGQESPLPDPPADGDGGGDGGGEGGGEGGGAGESIVRPSIYRVMHNLRRSMGVVNEFNGRAQDPAWVGYSVPSPLMVHMRQGGPTIGGPGFRNDGGPSGVVDPAKSPGIGFRSEKAWRVWRAAIDIMGSQKTLPQGAILMSAMSKTGVKIGDLDPAEVRLLEMGIHWYLDGPGKTPGGSSGDPSGAGVPHTTPSHPLKVG